jgi:hypothetical protein
MRRLQYGCATELLLRGHGEWRADGEGHKLLCRETEQLVIAYEDAKARRRGRALVCRHQEGRIACRLASMMFATPRAPCTG